MIAHSQFVYQYPGRLFRQMDRSRRSIVTLKICAPAARMRLDLEKSGSLSIK
jgi:hypothetical protein